MGARSLDKVGTALAGQLFLQQGLEYARAVKDGNDAAAAAILEALPSGSAAMVKNAIVSGQSSTIAMSMTVLGVIALAGAIMALRIIVRRRWPEGNPSAWGSPDRSVYEVPP